MLTNHTKKSVRQDEKCTDNAEQCHHQFWRSGVQHFCYAFAERVSPTIRSKSVKDNAEFLRLVRKYKPRIVKQCRRYTSEFRCWRDERKRHGGRFADAYHRKEEAREKTILFMKYLQGALYLKNYPYRKLPMLDELVSIKDGCIQMNGLLTYLKELEEFLRARSQENGHDQKSIMMARPLLQG